ncbi:unnamed protein product [Strongylus vulgaris]|uniref:Uncharacterized protein n=1 Tax=Strongylus vulgaris TaxID=40348 RepID=A0A3P7IDY6_STRVU|nr:unnamed protein product [Strongylus vulgaris]
MPMRIYPIQSLNVRFFCVVFEQLTLFAIYNFLFQIEALTLKFTISSISFTLLSFCMLTLKSLIIFLSYNHWYNNKFHFKLSRIIIFQCYIDTLFERFAVNR